MRIEAATATTATTSDEDDANDDGDGDERRRHGYDTTTRTEHCHPSRAEAGYDDDAATTRRDDDVTATTMRHDDDDATTSRACPSQSLQPQVPLTVAAPPGAPHSRCLVAASLAQPLQPPQQASLLLFTANARGWVRTAVEAQRRRGDDDTTTNTRRRPRGDNDRAPISATEMLPPNRADAGTRRRGDDEAATTTASLPLQPPGSQSLQPPRSQSLQCPGRHRNFRRRYSPSLAAASSLQVPSQSLQPPSLTGLTAPLTQEDGSVQLAQAFPSTVGHCRSKESKAQVQEPQQSKVSKEVAHINASEVQAPQPQSAEKPGAG